MEFKKDRKTAVEQLLSVTDNTVYAQDVYQDGEVSTIKSPIGVYQSPEHAQVMMALQCHPAYTLLLATGKLTTSTIDGLVNRLRQQTQVGEQSNDEGAF